MAENTKNQVNDQEQEVDLSEQAISNTPLQRVIKRTVEVKPVPRKKWHEKEGQESFKRPIAYEVLYSGTKGEWATGLTDEEEEIIGKRMGVNLSKYADPSLPHPYYSSQPALIKLEDNPMFFNTARDSDYVKVQNMKAHKFVANSMKEWEDGMWPEATHVIFDEEEEVARKASKIGMRNKAIQIAMAMSDDDKINIIQVVGEKSVRGKSANYITTELEAIIEDKEKLPQFLAYAQIDKKELYTRAAVLEAIHRNILTKSGSAIQYMGDTLGMDLESTVQYFLDPQNQKIKAVILQKLTV